MSGLQSNIMFMHVKIHQGMLNDPGIVPLAVASIFRAIEASPGRDFLLRLSMMEIYNEARFYEFKSGNALNFCVHLHSRVHLRELSGCKIRGGAG